MELGTTDPMTGDKKKLFFYLLQAISPQHIPWLDHNFKHGGEKNKNNKKKKKKNKKQKTKENKTKQKTKKKQKKKKKNTHKKNKQIPHDIRWPPCIGTPWNLSNDCSTLQQQKLIFFFNTSNVFVTSVRFTWHRLPKGFQDKSSVCCHGPLDIQKWIQ